MGLEPTCPPCHPTPHRAWSNMGVQSVCRSLVGATVFKCYRCNVRMQTIVPMGHRGTPEGTVGQRPGVCALDSGVHQDRDLRISDLRLWTGQTPVCLIRFSGDPRDIIRDMQQTRERSVPDPPCEEKRHSLRPLAALIIPCAPGPPLPLQAPYSPPEHCSTISVSTSPRGIEPLASAVTF